MNLPAAATPDATPFVAAAEPSQQARLEFLRSPPAWAGAPGRVETVETHMSWVFLGTTHVLKLKKPVRTSYLDFSTVALREADCRAELRLNRRLAPDVYLGLVALLARADGSLALAAEHEIPGDARLLDWLVRMRRLPRERMLDRAIAEATVGEAGIDRLADLLADFYRRLPPADVEPAEFVARFAREQQGNRAVLERPELALAGATATAVLDRLDSALHAVRGLLLERAATGRVVEGHGDLRPEHVCLNRPPVVIDCLEFDRRLRLVDPFEEIEFLALECGLAGAAWIGARLRARCAAVLHAPPGALRCFYTAYRAALRARLTLAHLLEAEPRERDKWMPLARRYVDAARSALDEIGG